MSELQLIKPENALAVFTTPNALDPFLAEIRKEIDAFVPDVTTKKGREEIASIAYRVASVLPSTPPCRPPARTVQHERCG